MGVVAFLLTDVEGSAGRWVGIAIGEAELRGPSLTAMHKVVA